MRKRRPFACGQHVIADTISGEVHAHVTTDDGGAKVNVGWVERDGGLSFPRVYEQGVDARYVRAAA